MIPLSELAAIKNNYCLCYKGFNQDIVVQMKSLRHLIEQKYTSINLFLCCRDELLYLLGENDKNICISNYTKERYAYTHELSEVPKGENPVNIFRKDI
jgi:hypothetical protein